MVHQLLAAHHPQQFPPQQFPPQQFPPHYPHQRQQPSLALIHQVQLLQLQQQPEQGQPMPQNVLQVSFYFKINLKLFFFIKFFL